MCTRLLLLPPLAVFVFASTVIANEAGLNEYSGSLALVDGDSTNIRMVSEEVIIELGMDSYTVDASFEFMNEGDTITIPVGFPDAGYGPVPGFRGVKPNETFETWVNGEPCDFRDMPGYLRFGNPEIIITDADSLNKALTNLHNNLPPMEGIDTYAAWELRWFVKDVTFPGGEKTVTRVRYTAEYGEYGDTADSAEYIYSTGRSWKGSIGTARFVIRTSPEVWMRKVPAFSYDYKKERAWVGERTGEFEHVYTLTNLEPNEDEVMRLSIGNVDTESNPEPWFIDPIGLNMRYTDTVVDNEFLDLLSLDQLRLYRDTIFAMRGKIFDDPALTSYFKSRLLYRPSSDFTESDLTAIDRENIRRITEKEQWLRELVAKKTARRL